MKNENLIIVLLAGVYTLDEAVRSVMLMKDYFETEYFKEGGQPSVEKFSEFLKEKSPEGEIREKELQNWFFEWEKLIKDRKEVQKIAQEVEKEIEALPVLTMFIPCAFPATEIAKLGQWIRAHTLQSVLLDVRIDPYAVGGCRLLWRGNYIDISLRYFASIHRNETLSFIKAATR